MLKGYRENEKEEQRPLLQEESSDKSQ